MNTLLSLTSAQLNKAAAIKTKIEALTKELASLIGSTTTTSISAAKPVKKGGMSAAGRAKISAAAKARWAKIKAAKPTAKAIATKPVVKKKGGISAAGRAKIAAAAKARWAKAKAAGKTKL